MDFDFPQLEAFVKVVETGGFSNAAKVLHLAQASVSERIANLETILDVKLLDRLGRGVAPTKAGELLFRRAVELLDRKRNLESEMAAFLGRLKGTLRIGGSSVPGNYILPDLLVRFRKSFPGIVVEVVVGDSAGIADMVEAGTLELGFVGSGPGPSTLEYTRLWEDELVLVVPPSHPWAGKRQVELSELSGQPLILREPGSGTRQSLRAELAGLLPDAAEGNNVACVLGSSDAVKEGVKGGLGLAFISARAVRTEVETGLLRIVKIRKLKLRRHFYLVRDPRRAHSPLSEAFMEFIRY
jgi:DNA-binding transcriptional LysR family regulator